MYVEEKEIYMNLSLEDNKKGLKNILNIDENNNDKEDELFIEKPISRICKLKSNTKVFIYTDLGSDEKYVSTKEFLNCSYYRSEEHTSELQSRGHLVCRLLLEKKNKKDKNT